MAYEVKIAETQQPNFAELYEIAIGGDDPEYYTSYIEDVSYLGQTYYARPIKRSEFTNTAQVRALRVKISAPASYELSAYLGAYPPSETTVRIVRLFVDGSSDAIVLFYGSLIAVTAKDHLIHADFEGEHEVFNQRIPRYVYQAQCNHRLFDSGCGLSRYAWDVRGTVSNIDASGTVITASEWGAYADYWFYNGEAAKAPQRRMITGHMGSDIYLQYPIEGLSIGDYVWAYPGCNKSYTDCVNKYNNFDNFLGFPYIPSINPVVWGF